MARSRIIALACTLLLLPSLTALPAAAAEAAPAPVPRDTRELTRKDFTLDGKPVKVPSSYKDGKSGKATAKAADTPPVGTVRQWLGLDDHNGTLYRKDYTLRAIGDKIEIWVANDLAFPEGDCRGASSVQITDAQVTDMAEQFDTTMYPKLSEAFSTAPDRDGTNATLGPDENGNGGVYTGAGDRTVTLVDNVRDANFYTFPAAPTYIAGFFSAALNDQFDRNVMTIDAFDWLHRTGANPPDEPTGDPCTSRGARPYLYESTFAHEYQHLLHYYTDPFETTWLNEGLSDFAQTLTGYVDAGLRVDEPGNDSHIVCWQGFGVVQTPHNPNPRDCGGPENSLNLWGEANPDALLADYGQAYAFMVFLYDRYGDAFMSRLHRDGDLQGLASLKAALGDTDLYQVLHDFQTMALVDGLLDSAKGTITGVPRERVTSASLNSELNLANPAAYATPGAAPNGADFVPVRRLGGDVLRSLSFQGAKTLPSIPLAWTVVANDPDRQGNPVLWSGNETNLNATAVAKVTVPAADPTLRFLAKYGAEAGFDYAYVVVSTDGGKTYTAIPGDKTVAAPLGPGLNGTTTGFEPHVYSLSAYAGQEILLGFRYVSDGGVNEGGLSVDDVKVGGTTVSDGSSLEPFDSPSEIYPTPVGNWNVRLVGMDGEQTTVRQVEYNGQGSINLNELQLAPFKAFPTVVAIVANDEPTEQVQQYAPYKLTVNGVVQPGG
ncbi:immune inhibitor A domain-containing protein [Nonomuraea aurantiaca]|uniref:immune inhibitor A domain-containing protein n=1 Tax=Nonomuraea aurantiaca TaxID=2878562 RepID=UPI001CDA0D78|nr:immune inhibitor A domain-containing protein [Nonomuraea aurantiaca]MCA2228805.1 immune inhibitor A [Nonomuraea aurantiaca]